MTPVPATTLYAGLLGLLFLALSVRVIGRRRRSGIGLGIAGSRDLERVARVHANFAEYVPLALLLLLLAELSDLPRWSLHVAGCTLLAGRLAHAYGVSREPEDFRWRVAGMAGTLSASGGLALVLTTGRLAGWI